MAATSSEAVDFLRTSLYKRSVLVVGDGNFSFSLSFALYFRQCGLNTPLVLTSLDSREKLKKDEVASKNLKALQDLKHVDVIHEVDATNLSKHFPNQKFGRIIFNFPHTGGKSNIKKCRKLLEDFFSSAVQHLDSGDGDICVTLCKGQGGLPLDQPHRTHGNSWQIVDNAAKAAFCEVREKLRSSFGSWELGLILHQVFPFINSDYLYYKSVGYRSRLANGFHTSGGLIHIFIPGVKINPMEDLSGETTDVILSHIFQQVTHLNTKTMTLCNTPGHPLHVLKKEIEGQLISLADQLGTTFEAIEASLAGNHRSLSLGSQNLQKPTTPNQKILSALKNQVLFALCDSSLTALGEITQTSNIITNNLLIGRLYDNHFMSADAEFEVVLQSLKKLFCISNGGEQEYVSQSSFEETVNESKIPAWTNSSQVAHLAKHRCHLNSKTNVETCSAASQNQVVCNCQELSKRYIGKDARFKSRQLAFSLLVLPETLQVFKTLSNVVMLSGRLDPEVLQKSGIDNKHGWLIKVNLGALAVARYDISDIRLLWSSTVKMEQQSTVTSKEGEMIETPSFIPRPLSLFPPSYIHDISFWVSDDVSQDLFILAAIALTKNCVKEIKLTEVYHDEDKHWLSFNYRMIYNRPDGPLSHLEAVEFQNSLRRALLALNFGLK